MKYFKHCTLLFIILSPLLSSAQDISYSQFINNPIYLNPALAGSSHEGVSINANTRLQNVASSNRLFSHTLSADLYSNKAHGGFALQSTNLTSNGNFMVENAVSIGYSFHQKLSSKYTLLVGGQLGWHQNFINWNKMTFGGSIDPTAGFIYPTNDIPISHLFDNGWGTKGFFDINVGAAIVSDNVYGGIAVKHLNTPLDSFINHQNRLPMALIGHLGTRLTMRENVVLSPNALYTTQGGFQSLITGLNAIYKIFTLGIYARALETVILSAGLEKERFSMRYSYDYGPSELMYSGMRAHELSLMLAF